MRRLPLLLLATANWPFLSVVAQNPPLENPPAATVLGEAANAIQAAPPGTATDPLGQVASPVQDLLQSWQPAVPDDQVLQDWERLQRLVEQAEYAAAIPLAARLMAVPSPGLVRHPHDAQREVPVWLATWGLFEKLPPEVLNSFATARAAPPIQAWKLAVSKHALAELEGLLPQFAGSPYFAALLLDCGDAALGNRWPGKARWYYEWALQQAQGAVIADRLAENGSQPNRPLGPPGPLRQVQADATARILLLDAGLEEAENAAVRPANQARWKQFLESDLSLVSGRLGTRSGPWRELLPGWRAALDRSRAAASPVQAGASQVPEWRERLDAAFAFGRPAARCNWLPYHGADALPPSGLHHLQLARRSTSGPDLGSDPAALPPDLDTWLRQLQVMHRQRGLGVQLQPFKSVSWQERSGFPVLCSQTHGQRQATGLAQDSLPTLLLYPLPGGLLWVDLPSQPDKDLRVPRDWTVRAWHRFEASPDSWVAPSVQAIPEMNLVLAGLPGESQRRSAGWLVQTSGAAARGSLVGLDLSRELALRWQYPPMTAGLAAEEKGWQLVAGPVYADGAVFCLEQLQAVQTELYLTKLASASGNLLWRKRLGRQHVAPPRGDRSTARPWLVAWDGQILVATQQGCFCSASATTGDLLWGARYSSPDVIAVGHPAESSSLSYLQRQTLSWLTSSGVWVVGAADRPEVWALNPLTGKRVWQTTAATGHAREAWGICHGNLILAGTKLQAIDLHSGKPAWQYPAEGELLPLARGVVHAGQILLPLSAAEIALVEGRTGLATRLWQLQAAELANTGVVLHTPRGLVLGSGEALSWFPIPGEVESRSQVTDTELRVTETGHE